VKRIFLTLAILAVGLIGTAFVLGLSIVIPEQPTLESAEQVGRHLLTAISAVTAIALVHAIAFTYFMGTGRWLEETTNSYRLDDRWQKESSSLKYSILPYICGGMLLIITTVGLGAATDPGSDIAFKGWAGIPASTIHFFSASTTVAVNLLALMQEYFAIHRNGKLIEEVIGEARRIREEKGLPV
jgi:hypothetical protein